MATANMVGIFALAVQTLCSVIYVQEKFTGVVAHAIKECQRFTEDPNKFHESSVLFILNSQFVNCKTEF